MNSIDDDEDQAGKVDVKSRIAALNSKNQSSSSLPSGPKIQTSPRSGIHVKTESPSTSNANDSGSNSSNVKSLASLYGSNAKRAESNSDQIKDAISTNIIEESPPIIPSRPTTILTTKKEPSTPPIRPQISNQNGEKGPPLLPPRPREDEQCSHLPYVPRKPQLKSMIDKSENNQGRDQNEIINRAPPKVPQRLGNESRKSNSSSGSIDVGQFVPALPPRKQEQKSTDSTSSRTTASTNSPLTPITPLRPTPSSAKISGQTFRNNENVFPPPRYIDSTRQISKPGLILATNNHKRPLSGRIQPGQLRKRGERDRMHFSCEPEGQAKERYSALFANQITLQSQRGGSSEVLEQNTIVRLWRRSRLDKWFLQQVWENAKKSLSGNEEVGIDKEAFIRSMCAIDLELARRVQQVK